MGITRGVLGAVTTYQERQTQLNNLFQTLLASELTYVGSTGATYNTQYTYAIKGNRRFMWYLGNANDYINLYALDNVTAKSYGQPGWRYTSPLSYVFVKNEMSGAFFIRGDSNNMWGFAWTKNGDVLIYSIAGSSDSYINNWQLPKNSENSLAKLYDLMGATQDKITDAGRRLMVPQLCSDDTNQYFLPTPCDDLFYMVSSRGLILGDSFYIGATQFVLIGYRLAIRVN